MKTFELQGTKFVPDGAFVEVPKGLDSDTDIVVHNLIRYLLSPAAQPQAYDNGYFFTNANSLALWRRHRVGHHS